MATVIRNFEDLKKVRDKVSVKDCVFDTTVVSDGAGGYIDPTGIN